MFSTLLPIQSVTLHDVQTWFIVVGILNASMTKYKSSFKSNFVAVEFVCPYHKIRFFFTEYLNLIMSMRKLHGPPDFRSFRNCRLRGAYGRMFCNPVKLTDTHARLPTDIVLYQTVTTLLFPTSAPAIFVTDNIIFHYYSSYIKFESVKEFYLGSVINSNNSITKKLEEE